MMLLKTSPFAWTSQIFFSFFVCFGICQSFWSVWFESQGLSMEQIGVLLGVSAVVRGVMSLFLTPLCSHVFRELSWLLLASTILCFSFFLSSNFTYLILLMVLFHTALAPIMPLIEGLANKLARLELVEYGKVRTWGTAGFIAGVTCIGYLIDSYGQSVILISAVFGFVGCFLLSLRKFNVGFEGALSFERPSWFDIRSMFNDKSIVKVLIVITLLQSSHAAYYSFSAIWWKSIGFDYQTISYFWSFSMIVEMILFAFSHKFMSKISVQTMLYIAGFGVVVRWSLTAFSENIAVILFAQALHCLTFAITHLAMMKFIQEGASKNIISLQAMYNGLSMSLGIGLMSIVSGWLFTYLGANVFLAMAILGVPAFLIKISSKEEIMSTEKRI